jgi:hypothetical protein
MSNRVRYVYIPIEKIHQAADFTEQELDGMDRAEAWNMFRKKEEEIEEWGDRLLKRFEDKKGQYKNVDVEPEPERAGGTRLGPTTPAAASRTPYERPKSGPHAARPKRKRQQRQILGSTKVLRHGDGVKPLQVITEGNHAVIYVHCHGNSQFVGLRPKKLRPAELAARLAEDGLPTPTPVIKLWSCHSGETYGGAERRFVDLFTEALGEQGYDGVEVYGYEGALYVTEGKAPKTATSTVTLKKGGVKSVKSTASDKRTEKLISRAKIPLTGL